MHTEITVFDMIVAMGIIPIYFLIGIAYLIHDYHKHKDDTIE